MKCLGKFKAKFNSEAHSLVEDIYVVEVLARPLFSKRACTSLNLLNRCNVKEIRRIGETNPGGFNQQSYQDDIYCN